MQILSSLTSIEALRSMGQVPMAQLDLAEERLRSIISAFQAGGWTWDPDEHGAIVLVEEGDDVRDFRSVGLNPEDNGFVGSIWEVCYSHPDTALFEVFIVYGNDTGWTFILPDSTWLDSELRVRLINEAEVYPSKAASKDAEQAPF